jgi:hypothetical protein
MLKYTKEDSNNGRDQRTSKKADSSDNSPDKKNQVTDENTVQSESQQQPENLAVSSFDKKIKRGTIVLAILFAIGLFYVLLMIKKSSPLTVLGQPSTEELQIESAIAHLMGLKLGGSSQIDQIVRKFNQFSDVKKLQIEQLQKNPFVHERYSPSIVLGSKNNDSELTRQAESMQLLSIMHSSEGNCCMIDDKILYEGDTIGGFEVYKITEYTVELYVDGMKFILRIPPEY